MTNQEVRTTLREALFAFLDQNCMYNASERQSVGAALQVLQPMCQTFESYNDSNPEHGLPATNSFLPPRYDRSVLEIDMYGYVVKRK